MGYVTAIIAAALGLELLLNAGTVAAGISKGFALCVEVLVPALFPFMALSCWLSLTEASRVLSIPLRPITERLFKLPRELGAIVLLSFVGGYPVGAKSVSLLLIQNRIDRRTAERMMCFCMNAGPSFVISAVGAGMLGDRGLGAALLAGQVCASVLVGIIVSRKIKPPQEWESHAAAKMTGPVAFVAAVSAAGSAVINMCAYTVLFSGALALVSGVGRPAVVNAAVAGLLEVTSGCAAAAEVGGAAGLALVSACLSFGGLSVWFQIISSFQEIRFSFGPLIKSRLIHALISIVITLLLAERLGASQTVFAPSHKPVFDAGGRSVFIACCLLIMCGFLTFDCREIDKNAQNRLK
jgi:sporulation integral membrane protein YlbJ